MNIWLFYTHHSKYCLVKWPKSVTKENLQYKCLSISMANECSSYCKSWKLIVWGGMILSVVKYKHNFCVQIVSLGQFWLPPMKTKQVRLKSELYSRSLKKHWKRLSYHQNLVLCLKTNQCSLSTTSHQMVNINSYYSCSQLHQDLPTLLLSLSASKDSLTQHQQIISSSH